MEDFTSLETNVLVDMLAIHTSDYTKMLTEGASDERYHACKTIITLLQSEIQSRTNITVTNHNLNFTSNDPSE